MEKLKANKTSRLASSLLTTLLLFAPACEFSVDAQTQKPWQWIKQLGSDSWDISAGIACDLKNNLYVVGSYYDSLKCNTREISSAGNQDIFVAIFNENGDLKDIVSGGGKGKDLATCLSVTPENNLVFGGVLSDTALFGKIKNPGTNQRLFVTSMDVKGSFAWVSTIAISGEASLFLISSDNQSRIYIGGVFSGKLEAGGQKVISNGKKDIFLGRLSKSGTVEKLYSFGSTEDDLPSSMSIDILNNVTVAGAFNKSFEAVGIKFIKGPARAKTNAFLAKFDSDFNCRWVNFLPGEDYCQVSSLKHDISGNLYVAGSFSSKLEVADATLISKGYTDAFLLKYTAEGKLSWSRSFGSWYYDYANHVNVDNLGGAIITGLLGASMSVDSLTLEPESKENSALVIQFSPEGKAIWGDYISGTGRNFSKGSVIDKTGNLYFTGSFRNSFEKDGRTMTSLGDQDIFLAKFYNCLPGKDEITGQTMFCPGAGTELSVKRVFTNVLWNDSVSGKYLITANKPGPYWVSMLDKNGCLQTDTILVSQSTLPVFSLGKDTTIAVYDSLLLKVPAAYTQYKWQDNSFDQVYVAKSTNRKPGTIPYWLEVTDSLSCSYSDTIAITYINSYDRIGLAKEQLVIYPNPVTDSFSWYLKTEQTLNLVAEISDENGRIIYRQEIKKYSPWEVKQISMDNIAAGPYIFSVTDPAAGRIYETVRIIKK
jgi:hypothetical protein